MGSIKSRPDISFVVSAFDDPVSLAACLWSLAGQNHKNMEILVTDNTESAAISAAHRKVVKQVSDAAVNIRYEKTAHRIPTSDPYHSAEWGARNVSGAFVCFPCDDCYYVPQFTQRMIGAAYRNGWKFVECGVIGGPEMTGVPVYLPMEWRTIKSNFVVELKTFLELGFAGKSKISAGSAADQYFGYQIRTKGLPWGKLSDIMVVHN